MTRTRAEDLAAKGALSSLENIRNSGCFCHQRNSRDSSLKEEREGEKHEIYIFFYLLISEMLVHFLCKWNQLIIIT